MPSLFILFVSVILKLQNSATNLESSIILARQVLKNVDFHIYPERI